MNDRWQHRGSCVSDQIPSTSTKAVPTYRAVSNLGTIYLHCYCCHVALLIYCWIHGESECVHNAYASLWNMPTEFFLNVFTEFAEFTDKNICPYSKRTRPCHFLYKRPGCYHCASTTHMRDRIFKFSLIHASVIYLILWIHWNHWIQWKFFSI